MYFNCYLSQMFVSDLTSPTLNSSAKSNRLFLLQRRKYLTFYSGWNPLLCYSTTTGSFYSSRDLNCNIRRHQTFLKWYTSSKPMFDASFLRSFAECWKKSLLIYFEKMAYIGCLVADIDSFVSVEISQLWLVVSKN